ncbi:MAG: isoprenylcysteine carboxylmethyltransferase family protein [Sulfurimonas sp.]
MKSKILVFLQFFIIFLMILPLGMPTKFFYEGLGVMAVGGLIGLLAIKEHGSGNFNIRPDIKEGCSLVTTGIYAYVRHPMYLSVLLMMFGFVLLYPLYYEIVLYLFLIIVIVSKMLYEERLWSCHDEKYLKYKRRVKRLIPFLF